MIVPSGFRFMSEAPGNATDAPKQVVALALAVQGDEHFPNTIADRLALLRELRA